MPESKPELSGVLPSQELIKLVENGEIVLNSSSPGLESINKDNIQPASIDLTLGPKAYRLQASFLPQEHTVEQRINDLCMYEVDLVKGGILEKGAVYLIPLIESLKLDRTLMGRTNPKSSTGRLDVFTRVITDQSSRFEEIAPGYSGNLYLEVVPRSFTIKVRYGQRLNQLRLFRLNLEKTLSYRGQASFVQHNEYPHDFICEKELFELYEKEELLCNKSGKLISGERHLRRDSLLMSVNLCHSTLNGGPIGFMAKRNSQVIDLEKIAHYDADDFWEAIFPPKNGMLILEPEEFYIFASKERIRVPINYSAEMVEFDAGSGELRTHYAGFFDPGFGYGKNGKMKGTKAVLEVRPHDVPFIIEDGQILFKMKYERMVEPPDIWYGSEIGSNYFNQTLRLSKQFKQ